MITRKRIAMIMAEFLGTALLTLAILAIHKTSGIGFPYFVAIGAGLVLAMATFVLGGVSGAHLNPIVTIGLWSIRKIKALPAVVYIASQMLGGIAAYYLFTYFVNQTFENTTATFESRVLVAEVIGGLVFALGWAAVVYNRMDTARAATVLSLSLIIGIMVASVMPNSLGLINPAAALGVHNWVLGTTVLGPILGAIIGFNLYSLLFAPASELVDKPAKR
jgi:glycerol uptake facilitator-like aquaporin